MSTCVATKTGAINPDFVKRCPRKATHGEWCRQHAESLGGWRLAPPGGGLDVQRLRALLHREDLTGRAIHEESYCAQVPSWGAEECSACQYHAEAIARAYAEAE